MAVFFVFLLAQISGESFPESVRFEHSTFRGIAALYTATKFECHMSKTILFTDMKAMAAALRKVRSNQPKATLREAAAQAQRVMEAGRNSPARFAHSSNGENHEG